MVKNAFDSYRSTLEKAIYNIEYVEKLAIVNLHYPRSK